jgi:microfibrillar-associated protein 1
MTKQPPRPERYYPGKALAEDAVSSDESEEEDEEEEEPARKPEPRGAPPRVTTSPAIRKPAQLLPTSQPKPEIDLEGFETASEDSDAEEKASDDGSDDGSDDESEDDDDGDSDEDSSSDDEPKRPMIAPKFISKNKRAQQQQAEVDTEARAAEEDRLRKEKADAVLQAQIERDAEARAAGKKAWDDEEVAAEDEVDDTDDVDPEAEHAAWKLRELKRVQRDRAALIAKEKEREEIERRRNLSAEEREREDREFLDAQAAEREGKGKMAYMQKYFHKGAFFNGDEEQDEEVKAALQRDLAGVRFEDETGDKSLLPEYMRIRDMTRLGRKGRTRYQDLKSEDTGRWGEVASKSREGAGLDARFRPDDRGREDRERTGANAVSIGERRHREEEYNNDRDGKRTRYE